MLRIEATVPSFPTSPSISVPPQPQSHPLLSPCQRFRVRVCVGRLAAIAVSEPTAAPSSPAALLRACSTSAVVAFPPSPSSVCGLPATAVVDFHLRQPRRRHRALPRDNPAPEGYTTTTCSTPALPPVSQRPTPLADTSAAHAGSITKKTGSRDRWRLRARQAQREYLTGPATVAATTRRGVGTVAAYGSEESDSATATNGAERPCRSNPCSPAPA